MDYQGFNGSNAIRLIIKTSIDFSSDSPTDIKIMYKKPDETTGDWTGHVLSGYETEGKVYYDMQASEQLTEGLWLVKTKLTYSDGRVIYTRWAKLNIGA